ncbi:MAG TPA: hypothetical protein VFO39_18605 [Candidatus Sulfotelmatobacter sp.]|nr:hypothetical protein [Candidatus Sulfotelmatobacter sp.]
MGYNVEVQKFTIHVSEDHVAARDLARLLGATDVIYQAITPLFVFGSDRFLDAYSKVLPDDARLRIASIRSGSDISLSFLGVDKALDALRKVMNEFRFRKERRKREEEKAKQEQEKTRRMKIENAQQEEAFRRMRIENFERALATLSEFKNLSPDERANLLQLVEGPLTEIDNNQNWIE